IITEQCNSYYARKADDEMCFSRDFNDVTARLNETAEMLSILTSSVEFPSLNVADVAVWIVELRSEGGYVSSKRYLELVRMIKASDDVRRFFNSGDSDEQRTFPNLKRVAERISGLSNVVSWIDGAINNFGEIKDNASEHLYEIRRELRGATGSMQRAMRRVLDKAISQNIIDRDVTPAVRDGRMVIPVEASKKRALQGIVHDSSATGKTVYIEPLEVVEASNHIRELKMAEHHEEIVILKNLASQIRPYIKDITASAKVLGKLEFIKAKANFAREVDGRLPILQRERCIEWYHAVHPALLLSLRAQGRKIVPLDLTLDETHRILVISGPNAGGKSVCLKTAGVVQYMMQCGLLPTLYENSHMGIFDNLYVDIGDEQSMESDLSTYSSHLKNMKFLLQHSSKSTLVLIDEMGSGTEPQIGGALAQAILSQLNKSHCMGIVTTHYQNLKIFAGEEEGFFNGAMLYDRQQLQPT
ncbi:MAG: endonuclease MutS2, partial [Muribaculaceae bacterium]|nr:endonuclease MutS2 [Muribaculaceae bacterium]